MSKKQKRKINGIFLGIIAFALGAIVMSFILKHYNENKNVLHNDPIDTKISQYSDIYIPQSAMETNLRFKQIAFKTAPPKDSIFSSQIAAVTKAINVLTNKQNTEKENGTWIWTPIMSMTPQYMENIISGAKKNGINAIYLSIDSYLDIFVLPQSEEKQKQEKIFGEKLENFIALADSMDIAVDAEGGWRNWAEDGNSYKPFAVVNYAKNFNATRKNKFRGFQYDVEPYLLDSYEKNSEQILKNFVALVGQTASFLENSDLRFSVVVPDFYDEKDGMTPKFSYNGKKSYTFKHLLNILDKKQNSSIIIMSYRAFAEGFDGSIEISTNEMKTAKKGSYQTKIIIAQETGEVLPAYLTFHNTSKNRLFEEIGKINTAFDPYSNFNGIAIHYANAFLALK